MYHQIDVEKRYFLIYHASLPHIYQESYQRLSRLWQNTCETLFLMNVFNTKSVDQVTCTCKLCRQPYNDIFLSGYHPSKQDMCFTTSLTHV